MRIEINSINAVLPHDGGFAVKETDIFIEADRITAVGGRPEGFTPDKIIDGRCRLAIPGMVNCHTHGYMALLRNIADDLTFDEWLFKGVMPIEDRMTGEDAYWGSMLAYAEMLKTGTTSFLDMHMFRGDCARAVDEIGIRGVLSRGLVGFGRGDEGGLRRIDELKSEMRDYANNPRLSFMVAPHAIYTTDREYLELCVETARELGLSIHTHVSETVHEVMTAKEKYGLSPVEYLNEIGLFDVNTVAAHCVHLSERDMQILAEKKVNVAANPRSNLKLANGIAPIPELQERGVNICIGTDGAASNNSLNMFSDMNYTALLHKGRTHSPTVTSAADVLGFATRNGAKALGLDTGVLEAGKKADIALLDLARPQFCPRHNLVAALVYSANGSEVDTVIVDGEVVLEGGKLTRVDEAEIYAKANEALVALKKKV